jgi:hypothetical protein
VGVVRAFRKSRSLKELEEMEDRFESFVRGAEVIHERIKVYWCGGEFDNPMGLGRHGNAS